MSWHSTAPIGGISVKANRTILQDNMTYIQTTMGNSIVGTNNSTVRDHFWDVGADEDGRHRFIQSVGYTSDAVAPNDTDPILGSGMQTVLYPKETKDEVQWFHKNVDNNSNLYQVTPNQLLGTKVVPAGYVTLAAVPAFVWGEIFMYTSIGTASESRYRTVRGFFRSDSTRVNSFAYVYSAQDDDTATGLKFGNGADSALLDIQVRAEDATAGLNWNYIIWYRAL